MRILNKVLLLSTVPALLWGGLIRAHHVSVLDANGADRLGSGVSAADGGLELVPNCSHRTSAA